MVLSIYICILYVYKYNGHQHICNIQGQVGQAFEKPGLVKSTPVQGRGAECGEI